MARDSAPEKSGERILALDLSSVCVGWATFDGNQLSGYGRYLQRGREHGEKLLRFLEWLEGHMAYWDPDQLIIEKPYPARYRKHTFGVLMLYLGIALLVHFKQRGKEIPKVNFFHPSSIKRVLKVPSADTHEGRKKLMVKEINRLYGLRLKFKEKDRRKLVSEDDVADAIALGRAWLGKYRT